MQVFNKVDDATVCGIDEALAVLRAGTGYWKNYDRMYPIFDRYIELKTELRQARARQDWEEIKRVTEKICQCQKLLDQLWVDTHDQLNIQALRDGDQSPAHDAVLTIEGQASQFAHLESIYLGILARSTKVATNTRRIVDAAGDKPVLFFADRFDRWVNQVADGYAALKAGIKGVASDAMGQWWGVSGLGTTPHALIALYLGDTAAATLAFARHNPTTNAISLTDFDNDCVATSLKVARAFAEAGKDLWGVRLDTSGTMVDRSVWEQMGQFKATGVCGQLVENVRTALDRERFSTVKILGSGGFNEERIYEYEKAGVPLDGYGVGSSILQGNFDHTADIVMVDSKPMAKVGRKYRPGAGLKQFNWSEIDPK